MMRKFSIPIPVPSLIVLIFSAGSVILAIIDDNFRNKHFGDLVKFALAGYLVHVLLRG